MNDNDSDLSDTVLSQSEDEQDVERDEHTYPHCSDVWLGLVKIQQSSKNLGKGLKNSEFYQMTTNDAGLAAPTNPKIFTSTNISQIIHNRQIGLYPYDRFSLCCKNRLNNRLLPNTIKIVDFYSGKIFCGIFSKDGQYYLTACQDRIIRLYDSQQTNYKLLSTYKARDIGWSIIDIAFSPSEQHFVYSTWSCSLHLCAVHDNDVYKTFHKPICLIKTHKRFCVFCVMFSSCGRELVGGASDGSIYIYDLVGNSRLLEVAAHRFDVNTIAYADDNCQIIYSGGDDGVINVWDRRNMNESHPNPVGILAGHTCGITHIDSRGDGRHLISNSKDQSIKLWDIRVFSSEKAAKKTLRTACHFGWDYRWQPIPIKLLAPIRKIEGDTSVMTYRGHTVAKTLIRCRFSPVHTTGQRYIYTGSGTGELIVYDALTGEIVVNAREQKSCVRDVYWHPYRNEILTSCWDGSLGQWIYTEGDEPGQPLSGTRSELKEVSENRRSARLAAAMNTIARGFVHQY